MDRALNVDCWLYVLDCLWSDRQTLFRLLLVDKAMFRGVAPILYCRPQIDFELSDKSETALLDLLRKKPSTRAVHGTRQISAEVSPTIDYYSLVQEMSSPLNDPTPGLPFHFKSQAETSIATYFRDFGSKIKKILVSVEEMETLQDHFRTLSHLHTLILISEEQFDDEEKDDFLQMAKIHRSLFPGILKTVSYLHRKDSGWVTDPTMMLRIREIMDGQWSLDTVQFVIPSAETEVNEDLLRVLEDPDLPIQIKSVKIFESIDGASNFGNQQLKLFLSRCRVLDSVQFNGVYDPELISWLVEEQRAVAEGVMASDDQVQWKALEVRASIMPIEEQDVFMIFVGLLEKFWKFITTGLGHCLEKLELFLEFSEDDSELFPTLSLPGTISLPKLKRLSVKYPNFSELSYTGIAHLRELQLSTRRVYLDENSQWQGWRI